MCFKENLVTKYISYLSKILVIHFYQLINILKRYRCLEFSARKRPFSVKFEFEVNFFLISHVMSYKLRAEIDIKN